MAARGVQGRSSCAASACGAREPWRYSAGLSGEREVKGQTTVVGNHQSPGDADAVRALLLGGSHDAYTTYTLPAAGTMTIGRGESNAVRVDDPLASRAHARLHVGEAMYLEDLGSMNGTRIKEQVVKRGDKVLV